MRTRSFILVSCEAHRPCRIRAALGASGGTVMYVKQRFRSSPDCGERRFSRWKMELALPADFSGSGCGFFCRFGCFLWRHIRDFRHDARFLRLFRQRVALIGEVHRRERRHADIAAVLEVLQLLFFRANRPVVVLIRAAVFLAVGVEALRQRTHLRQPDAVLRMEHGREVRHAQERVAPLIRAQERNDGVVAVVRLNPLEAVPAVINLVECGRRAVDFVQALAALLHLRMIFRTAAGTSPAGRRTSTR